MDYQEQSLGIGEAEDHGDISEQIFHLEDCEDEVAAQEGSVDLENNEVASEEFQAPRKLRVS